MDAREDGARLPAPHSGHAERREAWARRVHGPVVGGRTPQAGARRSERHDVPPRRGQWAPQRPRLAARTQRAVARRRRLRRGRERAPRLPQVRGRARPLRRWRKPRQCAQARRAWLQQPH